MKGNRGRPKKAKDPIPTQKATPITSTMARSGPMESAQRETEIGNNKQKSNGVVQAIDTPESSRAASERESQRNVEVEAPADKGKSPEVHQQTEPPISPPTREDMRLDYIAPTLMNGAHVACLDKRDVDEELVKWKNAIILYVIGDCPTIRYLQTFLAKQLQIENPVIFYHNDGYFIVRFMNGEDRDKVLFGGRIDL